MFDKFFHRRRYENAHYNFTNLFMWRKAYQVKWALCGEFLCVRACWEGKHFFLPPFGEEEGLGEVTDALMAVAQEENIPFIMQGVEKYMSEWVEKARPGLFTHTAERSNYDYVYLAQDLIELKGRKFHGKKNHVNGFRKRYPEYRYVPLTADMAEECIEFMAQWCNERGCVKGDSIDCERNAILEAINNFDVLGFVGGAIYIDGKMAAMTYGEMINDDTAVVHVEKGLMDYKGIYSVINQEFCAHNFKGAMYINREEDMGIEGLRKAKESYHPVQMIEKYVIKLQ